MVSCLGLSVWQGSGACSVRGRYMACIIGRTTASNCLVRLHSVDLGNIQDFEAPQ